MKSPRLTLTKTWYGYSDAQAEVILRAFEAPETVTPDEHLDRSHTPWRLSPLIDRTLLTAVIGDLLAETMRTVERLELQIARLEGELEQSKKNGAVPTMDPEEHADTYNDGTIGPRVVEPGGRAV